jgi:hypothetical protein
METQLFLCHREERTRFLRMSLRAPWGRSNPLRKGWDCRVATLLAMTIYCIGLPRCARNGGLPRPFRARNDIVKIYIALILTKENA